MNVSRILSTSFSLASPAVGSNYSHTRAPSSSKALLSMKTLSSETHHLHPKRGISGKNRCPRCGFVARKVVKGKNLKKKKEKLTSFRKVDKRLQSQNYF